MAKRLARQELYDLVWSEPVRVLGPRFGISDVAFKKACARANVPVPERGYWNKRHAGKNTVKRPLPIRLPGMDDEVSVGGGRYHWWQDTPSHEELLGPLPPKPSFEESIETVRNRVREQIGKVATSKTRVTTHPTITQLLEEDEQRREKQRNVSYPIWDALIFDSPLGRRRLRILNSLFLTVAKVGARSSCRGREAREIEITVGQRRVGLKFDQITAKKRSSTEDKNDSGRLRLAILVGLGSESERMCWRDEGPDKLEDRLAEIATEIIVSGELQYRESRLHMYEWRIKRKAQLIEEIRQQKIEAERLEREKQIKAEKKRVDRLLAEAVAHRQSNDIRAYVAAVRSADRSPDTSEEEIERWCDWAIGEADRIDPIVNCIFLTDRSYDKEEYE